MAKEKYNHVAIEKTTQEMWSERSLYETDLTDSTKEPYFLLFEFPYPSGDLHVGHWYAFALTDVYARMLRMQGKNVLFPIGFDSFGLPTENAAIKNNVDPREWTESNMERMRAQIRSMGTSVDWSKEISSSDPEFYRWTQWLFAKLFEQGLAERRLAPVKWCSKDQTVLAHEQVLDGKCERCGTEVEEKNLTQWFLKTTKYAKRLLEDLDALPWREEIKDAQRAWIGESEGAKLTFAISGHEESIEVFTTRPDTIFGATYVVLAPEHPAVSALLTIVSNSTEVEKYILQTSKKTERERSENKQKTGVKLEGVFALNPATKEEIPVYVADYVLASYGTGAVMAVPAHDERDFAFSQRMNLPVLPVVVPEGNVDGVLLMNPASPDAEFASAHIKKWGAYVGDGILINSGEFDGRDNREAMADIVAFMGGEMVTNYRMRDWLVSRQRYWGCPIPVVYDPEGIPRAVPPEHLPWLLPTDVSSGTRADGQSPLAGSDELRARVTRLFGEGWTPEYDTLDVFVDSAWYFTRYLSPKNERAFSDNALMKKWLPINRYSGGSEHTTVHLLYSRFFYKALYDLALVPTSEPFLERFNRGLILGTDGQKMSKRWGNIVNPDEMVQKFGADAVRMYLAFIGPYNEPGNYPWKLDGVQAMRKFLDRVYLLREKVAEGVVSDALRVSLQKASNKVGDDIEKFKLNTAVSALMILVRELEGLETVPREAYRALLVLLAPYAPHLADHLWQEQGGGATVHEQPWPERVEEVVTEVTIGVQVNGRKRGEITLSPSSDEGEALTKARSILAIETALGGRAPTRIVYVPGRILNLIADDVKRPL